MGRLPVGGVKVVELPLPTPGLPNPEPFGLIEVGEEELLGTGHEWSYLDNAAAPATDWAAPDFDDSGWLHGMSELGYGDGDEATFVRRGDPAGVATFFRTLVHLPDDGQIYELQAGIRYDDGAVIYIDGLERGRKNMPPVESVPVPDHTTLASGAVAGAAEDIFHSLPLPGSVLAPGEHVVAVSVHQSSPASTDLSFDFKLVRKLYTEPEHDPLTLEAFLVFNHLRVTELHYHPAGNAPLEFIELQNTSDVRTLDLDGVRIEGGVDFTFPPMMLAPGEYVLVAQDAAALESMFRGDLMIAGEFNGRLANGDDVVRVVLPAPLASGVLDFEYEDYWHPATDGGGLSLNVIEPASARRSSWREGTAWQGLPPSPGTGAPPAGFVAWALARGVSDPSGDINGDGVPHLVEYGLALEPAGPPAAPLRFDGEMLRLDLPASVGADVGFAIERSEDGAIWEAVATRTDAGSWSGELEVTEVPDGSGRRATSIPRSPAAGTAAVFRLRVFRP